MLSKPFYFLETDENKFNLFGSGGMVRVWITHAKEINPQCYAWYFIAK